MNKSKSSIFLSILLIISTLAIIVFYFFYLRNLVKLAYYAQAPLWFEQLIQTFYPRFLIEKHRFDLNFFLQKADQVILRASFLSLSVLFFIFLFFHSAIFQQKIKNFWDRKTSTYNVAILKNLFVGLVLYCVWDWIWIFQRLEIVKSFYQPVFLIKILGLPFPPFWIFLIIYNLLIISLLALLLNFRVFLFSLICSFLFIILQGYLYSFHKLDHTFATLTYASLGIPFLLYENQKNNKNHSSEQVGWALWLIQLLISLAYFFAGLEKILIGGLDWFAPKTLQTYLLMHQSPAGIWLAEFDWLCSLLAILVVLFELGFLLIVFFPRFKWFFIVSGIIFHCSTTYFLNVGGYLNPWILVYVFFIDWSKMQQFSPIFLKENN